MIRVERLTMRFGTFGRGCRAVDDLTFDVMPGEALALWGPNGAGKTTCIRCILGLLRPEGRITIAGFNTRTHGKRARRALGYVPQELCLPDDMRAIEALHFYGRLKRAPRHRPAEVLREVGLDGQGGKRVRELSGGMKQRLALAIALLADPPLLVLDELTSNLDAAARASFMHLLSELKARGKTLLFTSHRLEEVEQLADRVLVLESGRIRLECTGTRLAAHLGLQGVLKIVLRDAPIHTAIECLRQQGFHAAPNGVGLLVRVAPDEKAMPIATLLAADIRVRDFELLADAAPAAEPEATT
jgi:ABC-type multidrug transport system ATPase subunit